MNQFNIENFNSNENMCIEASAGTGKTYTVQQIVAELLRLNPKRSLSQILIVTYTEKAAGELRDRIRAKINEVVEKKDYKSGDKYLSIEEQESNFKEQLALVDNAPIYTIHSFCNQTLSEYGFEANQSDNFDMVDEAEVMDFIEKWIRDVLSEDETFKLYYTESDGKNINVEAFAEAIKKYYLDSNDKEVEAIVTLDKTVSSQYLENIKKVQSNISTYVFNPFALNFLYNFEEKLDNNDLNSVIDETRAKDEFLEFKTQIELEKTKAEAAYKAKQTKTNEGALANCNAICSFVNDKQNADCDVQSAIRFSNLPKGLDYFDNLSTKLKELYKRIKDLDLLEELKKMLFEQQIPKIYKAWLEYKAGNKLQSYDDLIRNVREAICKENSSLKAKLKEVYSYAIIDEFQDTNQKQWDIFKSIFMEDENHSICVVGDPKQSIYAFQGADVNVYTTALEEIVKNKGTKFNLGRNYRSTNKMIDFCNDYFSYDESFFNTDDIAFTPSGYPENKEDYKADATYKGAPVAPVWVPEKIKKENPTEKEKAEQDTPITETQFAEFTVQQIIDCCTVENGKTRLQVYKKKDKKLCDVCFSDFAVLCKKTAEMKEVEVAFRRSGIPYNHYKETNLYGGKECQDWIALLHAISAPDFSSSNRKILNECLYTSFFNVPLSALQSEDFDKPDNPQRVLLIEWKKIAAERKWALLQEQIFEKSGVETRLSQLDKLSSLSKLRQIGDYCVSYLYKNNCTLQDLVDHLSLLAKAKSGAEDDNGDLVEKGTDFNSVKIMTIHASKGLEFPVVIATGGLKSAQTKETGVYTYHINNKFHLSYNSKYVCSDKETVGVKVLHERDLENRRLFYVAYTRASSLMIIHWQAHEDFDFLNKGYMNEEFEKEENVRRIPYPVKLDVQKTKLQVQEILQSQLDKEAFDEDEKYEQQKEALEKLTNEMKKLDTYKLSYSNLSDGKKEETVVGDEDAEHDRSRENLEHNLSMFDTNPVRVSCNYNNEKLSVINPNYPKGRLLGEAVHQTFEETLFKEIGNLGGYKEAEANARLCGLIKRKFSGQGIKIDEKDTKGILRQTCDIVWNTLNAVLPEIKGSNATGKTFSLKDLEDNEHYAELEFNMNPDIAQNKSIMKDYFNGFIDLLFVREIAPGQKVYSVLDWKTDSKDKEKYVDKDWISEHTDETYSIQRVLYSYCLIKWLKQFNPEMSESEIFKNQFGGFYYVFVRGCKEGTGNGIYAQTWNSWEDLEKNFNLIIEEKITKGNR